MLQVILIFSDWILIKQILVSSTLFVLGETDFQKILPRVLEIHRFDAFSRKSEHHIIEKFFPHVAEHTSLMSILERQNPSAFKEIQKDVSLRLVLEDKDKGGYQFVGFNLGVGILLKKREHHKKGVLKQKSEASLYTLYWDFKISSFQLYNYVLAKVLQNGAKFI